MTREYCSVGGPERGGGGGGGDEEDDENDERCVWVCTVRENTIRSSSPGVCRAPQFGTGKHDGVAVRRRTECRSPTSKSSRLRGYWSRRPCNKYDR